MRRSRLHRHPGLLVTSVSANAPDTVICPHSPPPAATLRPRSRPPALSSACAAGRQRSHGHLVNTTRPTENCPHRLRCSRADPQPRRSDIVMALTQSLSKSRSWAGPRSLWRNSWCLCAADKLPCPLIPAPPPCPRRSYCMDAVLMQPQRHGCGSHAIRLRHGWCHRGGSGSCDREPLRGARKPTSIDS